MAWDRSAVKRDRERPVGRLLFTLRSPFPLICTVAHCGVQLLSPVGLCSVGGALAEHPVGTKDDGVAVSELNGEVLAGGELEHGWNLCSGGGGNFFPRLNHPLGWNGSQGKKQKTKNVIESGPLVSCSRSLLY